MKKLLLISALAFGAFAANAAIGVTVDGKPVANGAEVVSTHLNFQSWPEYDDDGQEYTYSIYTLDPEVTVTADVTGLYEIEVTNTTTDDIEGMGALQMCWPTQCHPVPLGGKLTETGILNAGVPTNISLDSTDGQTDYPWPNQQFSLSCIVKITEFDNPSNTFSFSLTMTFEPELLGVETITKEESAPVYYDLQGRRVVNLEKGQLVIERRGATAVKKIMK